MSKKLESTYDKFVRSLSPEEKKDFDRERETLLISEMVLAAIQQDYAAVKELAQMAGISSSVIQDMVPKSKNKFDAQIFFTVLNNLGYKLIIERKNSRVQLGSEE